MIWLKELMLIIFELILISSISLINLSISSLSFSDNPIFVKNLTLWVFPGWVFKQYAHILHLQSGQ